VSPATLYPDGLQHTIAISGTPDGKTSVLTAATWQLLTLNSGICRTREHCFAKHQSRAGKTEGHVVVECCGCLYW